MAGELHLGWPRALIDLSRSKNGKVKIVCFSCSLRYLTAWLSIPTDALRIPIPEVDDFPTDDALLLGRFLVPFRSFGDFAAVVGVPLLKP